MLNEKEHRHLKRQAEIAGIGAGPFIRKLIMGENIKPRPSDQYADILRELKAQGNNLNQIARMVNSTHTVQREQMNECVRILGDVWRIARERM